MTPHSDFPSAPLPPGGAPFDADDPRWSAYLLGELSAADRLAIEAILEENLAARREFEDLADAADLVRQALELESVGTVPTAVVARSSISPPEAVPASAPAFPAGPTLELVTPAVRRPRVNGRLAFAAVAASLGLCLMLLSPSSRPQRGAVPMTLGVDARPHLGDLVADVNIAPATDWAIAATTTTDFDGLTRFLRYTPSLELTQRATTQNFRFLGRNSVDALESAPSSAAGLVIETARARLRDKPYEEMEAKQLAQESRGSSEGLDPVPGLQTTNPQHFAELGQATSTAAAFSVSTWSDVLLINHFQTPATAPVAMIPLQTARQTMVDTELALGRGEWPAPETVRLEELVNAFEYDDPLPTGDEVVQLRTEAGACPWNERHRLVRIGLRAEPVNLQQRPMSRLVFVVLSSQPDALTKLGESLAEVSSHFTPLDRFTLIDADGSVAMPTVAGDQVEQQVRRLKSSAAVKREQRPQLALKNAYQVASQTFTAGANNSVVLYADEPVATVPEGKVELFDTVRLNAGNGVTLSAVDQNANFGNLGFYRLVETGNGSVNTISTAREISEAVVGELVGGEQTVVATEARLEVEFNPVRVEAYRLLGYEHWNRQATTPQILASQKELRAGHRLSALFEVRLNPETNSTLAAGPLRYRQQSDASFVTLRDNDVPTVPVDYDREWLTTRLSYIPSGSSLVTTREVPLEGEVETGGGSSEIRWAASVVDFGQSLKEPDRMTPAALEMIRRRAAEATGPDPQGDRQKFLGLLGRAIELTRRQGGGPRTPPVALSSREARQRAACDGRYRDLLDKFSSPEDHVRYGAFHDLGYQPGQSSRGHADLPAGYWVYVYPHWYIWGIADEPEALLAAPPPPAASAPLAAPVVPPMESPLPASPR